MTPKEIIGLSSTDALGLHERAIRGVVPALADYVRWTIWRTINKREDINDAQKLEALLAFFNNVDIVTVNG